MIQPIHIYDKYSRFVNPGEVHVAQWPWVNAGVITVIQAALTGTERDNASVVALASTKKVIYQPEDGTVALEFRFRTKGDENDAPVLEMYAAEGADFYTRVVQLTITQGTQLHSTGIYFADTIAKAYENWLSTTFLATPTVSDNHISRYGLNTHGYDRFLFICSNLATVTELYIDVRRF